MHTPLKGVAEAMPPPIDREADRWRSKAEQNMAMAARLLVALLFAAKELVSLSTLHTPDDFSHCPVCKVPWPCQTAKQVRAISEVFERAAAESEGADDGTS